MLVSFKNMLQDAKKHGYAVPAFDISNSDMLISVMEVCKELGSPALLSTLECDIVDERIHLMVAMVQAASEQYGVPTCLHLDHSRSLEQIERALKAGYSSVMLDASVKSFEENVNLTKQAANLAHRFGASLESELGHVGNGLCGGGGIADSTEMVEIGLTHPDEVREFVDKTHTDALAVAIGTVHGVYQTTPQLRFDILEQITKGCDVPLVIHGGSGTPDANIQKAISMGICKVNIYSEVMNALNSGLKQVLDTTQNLSIWASDTYAQAFPMMKDVIRKKILLCGSEGRV